jgi:hypothetical protein
MILLRSCIQKSNKSKVRVAITDHNGKHTHVWKLPDSDQFVMSPIGTKDFGQIAGEIAALIGREAAPIRLRKGDYAEGERHINRPKRLAEIQDAGYKDEPIWCRTLHNTLKRYIRGVGDH